MVTVLALVLGLVFFTFIANIQRNLALKESLDCGGCPTAQNELAAGSVCYKCFCQRSSNVVSQRSFCPEEFNRYVWRIVMSFVAPLSNRLERRPPQAHGCAHTVRKGWDAQL